MTANIGRKWEVLWAQVTWDCHFAFINHITTHYHWKPQL
jgi:hypothetical protein